MISGVVELRSRTVLHTCARTADHRVACWGSDNLGQLGNGIVDNVPHPFPEFVVGLP